MEYNFLYVQFLYYFNIQRDYFECHEVMEELWMEEGRDALWQGLLQVAVGLYHARNNNVGGAVKLFEQALNKLARYPGQTQGIDLGRLIEESGRYVRKLKENRTEPFPFEDLSIRITDPQLAEAVEQQRQTD